MLAFSTQSSHLTLFCSGVESAPLRKDSGLDLEEQEEPPLTLIVHPQHSAAVAVEPKALWRKREVVKQERTVHYTTVDAEGALQVSDSCTESPG